MLRDSNKIVYINKKSANEATKRGLFAVITATTIALIAFCVAFYLLGTVYQRVNSELTPFDTDEADHAVAALEVFVAAKSKNAAHLIQAVREQAFYPPLHSLFVATAYAIADPSVATSRLPSILFLGLEALLLFYACFCFFRYQDFPSRIISGSVALIFTVTCYTAILNSALCMLEPVGMFFTAALLLSIVNYEQVESKQKYLAIAAILAFLICLSKYSFGIVVAPALVLAVFFEPGLQFRQKFRNSFIVGCVILLLLICWLLLTDHYAAWRFIVGHPSSGPIFGMDNLLFDVKAWVNHYGANSIASILALALAAYAVMKNWNSLAVRLAGFTFILSAIVFTLSTTNEIRHFLVASPGVWFLAGIGLVQIGQKLSGARSQITVAFSALLLFTIIGLGVHSRLETLQRDLSKEFEGSPVLSQLHNYIAANTDITKPILVNGLFDQFGTQAVTWNLARTHLVSYRGIQLDSYPFREDIFQRTKERKRNIPYPWTVEGFPKDSLPSILATKHYATAILVRHNTHRRFKNSANKEFQELLKSYPHKYRKTHGWTVTIYDLQNQ